MLKNDKGLAYLRQIFGGKTPYVDSIPTILIG